MRVFPKEKITCNLCIKSFKITDCFTHLFDCLNEKLSDRESLENLFFVEYFTVAFILNLFTE